MTVLLVVLAFLAAISAAGAVWDRLGKRRRRRLSPSDAERRGAQGTLDYYAEVWDSSNQ